MDSALAAVAATAAAGPAAAEAAASCAAAAATASAAAASAAGPSAAVADGGAGSGPVTVSSHGSLLAGDPPRAVAEKSSQFKLPEGPALNRLIARSEAEFLLFEQARLFFRFLF